MPLLGDIRRLFTKKKDVPVIDLTENGNDDAAEALRALIAPEPAAEPSVESSPASNGSNGMHNPAAALPVLSVRPEPVTIDALDERLERNNELVLSRLDRIEKALEAQAASIARLTEGLNKLPPALETLPELNRQCVRLLEVLTEHLGQAKTREESLRSALARLEQTAQQQTGVLGLLQEQLDTNGASTSRVGEAIDRLHPLLADLSDSNTRTRSLVAELARASDEHNSSLLASLRRVQWWIITAVLVSGLASAAGIAAAVFAFTRMPQGS